MTKDKVVLFCKFSLSLECGYFVGRHYFSYTYMYIQIKHYSTSIFMKSNPIWENNLERSMYWRINIFSVNVFITLMIHSINLILLSLQSYILYYIKLLFLYLIIQECMSPMYNLVHVSSHCYLPVSSYCYLYLI